ncbi:gliding motility-associated C-terminal domain-containing protein [Mucilaginibacter ximonensis]|uniref:Gliding motility-associated C-terminal domain-containing protein n=1 Tax=Mucilaginibacter ximonensis TaxID=538021 RepID=A0ABW5YGA4_9SPHI
MVINKQGDIIFADFVNSRVRKIDAQTGIINTIAGNGQEGFNGNGGPATAAQVYAPMWLTLDAEGNVYICAGTNNTLSYRVFKVNVSTGIITTVAGNGKPGFSGDGGDPINASMNPSTVVFNPNGDMFIGDCYQNYRIRKVNFPPLSNPVISFTGTCAQEITKLNLSAPYDIDSETWTVDGVEGAIEGSAPNYIFATAGNHTVNVTIHSAGKSAQSSVLINVKDCSVQNNNGDTEGAALIPNTFTPNGDGINDLWDIKYLKNYPNCTVKIYNRNGEQLYYSHGYGHPWNGTYNNQPLPFGSYYYVISLGNDTGSKLSGYVAIVK